MALGVKMVDLDDFNSLIQSGADIDGYFPFNSNGSTIGIVVVGDVIKEITRQDEIALYAGLFGADRKLTTGNIESYRTLRILRGYSLIKGESGYTTIDIAVNAPENAYPTVKPFEHFNDEAKEAVVVSIPPYKGTQATGLIRDNSIDAVMARESELVEGAGGIVLNNQFDKSYLDIARFDPREEGVGTCIGLYYKTETGDEYREYFEIKINSAAFSESAGLVPRIFSVSYNTEGLSENLLPRRHAEGDDVVVEDFTTITVQSTGEPILGWTALINGEYVEFNNPLPINRTFIMPGADVNFLPILTS